LKNLVFATNIKREIISNQKGDKSPASDVLGMICGANFVGVDRDPMRGFKVTDEQKKKKIILDKYTTVIKIRKLKKVRKAKFRINSIL